jgi:mannose-6-phosphate isomerase-like protein (cupin superfamily)
VVGGLLSVVFFRRNIMKTGDIFVNPVTGMRVTVLQTPEESGGRSVAVEYRLLAHTGRDFTPAHRHRFYVERFDILAGRAAYVCGDEERVAEAGETVVIPLDTTHLHPWSISDEELVVRQTTEATRPDAKTLAAALAGVETGFGLAREGKVDANGRPNPLQAAILFNALLPDNYLPNIPLPAQRLLFGALAGLGQLLGYRLTYERFRADKKELQMVR